MCSTYFFQRHAVLNEQGYPRVKIPHVLFEDEVLLRLRRDLGLEFAEDLLGCAQLANSPVLGIGPAYLLPGRPRSPAPCPLQTWTDTAR
jgi:hypothetical protein